MPKQLINVLGAVVLAFVLVAGVLLIAMPMYLQSLETARQADQVSQTNATYQAQVDVLNEENKHIDQLTADVASLQAQIPAIPQSDDVFELVASAAQSTGVTVVSVTATGATAWTAPTSGSSITSPPTADPAPSPEATSGSSGTVTPPTAPRMEVPFSISITAPDAASASAFIDALGAGPRLIAIVSSTLTAASPGYGLDLEATSFVRTEK